MVDLLVNQLKIAIRELLERKGVNARVLDKVNARGEVVIGVILDTPHPRPPAGPAGKDGPELTREERKERQQR